MTLQNINLFSDFKAKFQRLAKAVAQSCSVKNLTKFKAKQLC